MLVNHIADRQLGLRRDPGVGNRTHTKRNKSVAQNYNSLGQVTANLFKGLN